MKLVYQRYLEGSSLSEDEAGNFGSYGELAALEYTVILSNQAAKIMSLILDCLPL